ncbi:12319_t:CDS:1 [Acaulospora colombiana]|uniref:12319_t:CDS:1 n=1 Tax=Acaulospora colombiana TaxID=27376 RepID=A0ACA9JX66_9GLOM|nr:12319_t:CDS:1 [Acaulospora colombiana]
MVTISDSARGVDPTITSTLSLATASTLLTIPLTLQSSTPSATLTPTISSNLHVNESGLNKSTLLVVIISFFFGLLFLTGIFGGVLLYAHAKNRKRTREFLCRATQTDPSPEFPALSLSKIEKILPKRPVQPIPNKKQFTQMPTQRDEQIPQPKPWLPSSKAINLVNELTKKRSSTENGDIENAKFDNMEMNTFPESSTSNTTDSFISTVSSSSENSEPCPDRAPAYIGKGMSRAV